MEKKADAMLAELTSQRNSAFDRCVVLAGDLAIAKARIAMLEEAIQPKAVP